MLEEVSGAINTWIEDLRKSNPESDKDSQLLLCWHLEAPYHVNGNKRDKYLTSKVEGCRYLPARILSPSHLLLIGKQFL